MWQLARSRNYAVLHEYEAAFIEVPGGRRISAGHFYGDPACAVIDWQERWCVVAGCGLLVYFLREPFAPVGLGPSDQWARVYHEPGAERWVEALYQRSDDAVRFVVDPGGPNGGVYELRLPGLEVEVLVGRG